MKKDPSQYKDCSYNELYPLQVLDDSMEPEFPKGCVIVIEPSERCATGAFVVIRVGEERWFRKLVMGATGPHRLEALNDAYHAIDLSDRQFQIEGVIVQRNIRRRIKHYNPYQPNNGEGPAGKPVAVPIRVEAAKDQVLN